MAEVFIFDPRLRALAESFESKVRYAAEYHGLAAGKMSETHTKTKRVWTIPIQTLSNRAIGQVSHVQYRARGSWDAYTVTQTRGFGSYGKSGIMLAWLKKQSEPKRPNLRVVTADDVLGTRK